MTPALPPSAPMAIAVEDVSALAWCRIGEHLVFLDVARDRYFRLPPQSEREFLAAGKNNARGGWAQPDFLPRPSDWQKPAKTSPAQERGTFNLARVARALWIERRIETRIATTSFQKILENHRRFVERRAFRRDILSGQGSAVVHSFGQTRLLRTSADRCLPRSLALSSTLAAVGDATFVVLGVSLHPFRAHCWVQHGETVLNDSIEEVLRYTPILVV